MKKLMKKKNNKGFSLVELIVVVLILGIIAVALAPQVMKWVGTARTNSDDNTAKDIKSAVQVALADFQQKYSLKAPASGETYSFKVEKSGTPAVISTGIENFDTYLNEVMNEAPKPSTAGKVFQVTINYKTYAVEVTQVDE